MKKMFALLLCLALLGTMMLPVLATESTADTTPTTGTQAPQGAQNGSHAMAILCGVLVVAGGAYLAFGMKKMK